MAEENTAPGGDLNTLVARPHFEDASLTPRFAVEVEEAEDGAFQSYVSVPDEMVDLELKYSPQDVAQLTSFRLFWRVNQGAAHDFTWTDPRPGMGGTNYRVRFDPDAPFSPRQMQPGAYEWTVKLKFARV